MAEDKYQRNAKEVSGFLRDPHVEGVYEVTTTAYIHIHILLYITCVQRTTSQ
jgi:hypothetical protein